MSLFYVSRWTSNSEVFKRSKNCAKYLCVFVLAFKTKITLVSRTCKLIVTFFTPYRNYINLFCRGSNSPSIWLVRIAQIKYCQLTKEKQFVKETWTMTTEGIYQKTELKL